MDDKVVRKGSRQKYQTYIFIRDFFHHNIFFFIEAYKEQGQKNIYTYIFTCSTIKFASALGRRKGGSIRVCKLPGSEGAHSRVTDPGARGRTVGLRIRGRGGAQ